jgi:hypothetical protein
VVLPAALRAVGFGAAGVVAGSTAATFQAGLGGVVAASSWFAGAQSVAAAGLATMTAVTTAGAGAVIGGIINRML